MGIPDAGLRAVDESPAIPQHREPPDQLGSKTSRAVRLARRCDILPGTGRDHVLDFEERLRGSLEDRYVIEARVGSGGMSIVYRATDLKHNRTVAIKVLRPELSAAVSADRFHREIEVVASLTHPHILPLHDSGEADGLLYFVMPFIQGESLRERLERETYLPLKQALVIARELAGALGFAHRHGVVHRDVKPGNILLAEDHALLADFGIARLAQPTRGTLTGRGFAVGTPAYFSPEQATGDSEIDGRSDIYSLGCVLFESLAGQPPFSADSVRALMTKQIVEPPPALRSLRPEAPAPVEHVVQTALEKDPRNRFQTGEEMAAALELASSGLDSTPAGWIGPLVGRLPSKRGGRRLAILVATVALVAVAGVLSVRSLREGSVPDVVPVSYLLLPYSGTGATEREAEVAELAVQRLSFYLRDYSSVRVLGPFELEGRIADLQLAGLIPPLSRGVAETLADQVGATHIVVLRALALGDSVRLQAAISARGTSGDELVIPGSGLESELDRITAGIALEILGLNGEAAEWDDFLRRSRNHVAHQEFEQGRTALYSWRLAEAERHFRNALAADSLFAATYHYLAQTLYWQTARNESRNQELGPEIEGLSRRAELYGSDENLKPREQLHVAAFRAFWTGEYDSARTVYDSILGHKPADMEALLLRASVELEDPWLAESPDGSLQPNADFGLARSLFDSTAAMNSQWQIAWGRLLDIDYLLGAVAFGGGCPTYTRPEFKRRLTPYAIGEAAQTSPFCPVLRGDTVAWIADSLTDDQRALAQSGVRDLHSRTEARLDTWARAEKDQPRQHEELSDWYLWERAVPGCATDPASADSLARLGLEEFDRALELRGDTTAEDRVRLAALGMAAGDVEGSREEMAEALAALGDWHAASGPMPPYEAVNPFLATGDRTTVTDLLRSIFRRSTASVRDPEDPNVAIDLGDVWATIMALNALGLMGSPDAELQPLFDELDRAWSRETDGPRSVAVRRWASLPWVGPAVSRSPAVEAEWIASIERSGLDLPRIWQGLIHTRSDPARARDVLAEVVREIETEAGNGTLYAEELFLPLELAERLDEREIAEDLRRRALSCPLDLSYLDFGWGLRHSLRGS